MKYLPKFIVVIATTIFISSCGNGDGTKKVVKDPVKKTSSDSKYGIGPIAKGDVAFATEIDVELAKKGEAVYASKCTACHKPDKKFIGPAPKGVLDRRTPEWVMNMILNPEEMVQKNKAAKELLMEFNGAPMANQNLTTDEARQILEYFRTL